MTSLCFYSFKKKNDDLKNDFSTYFQTSVSSLLLSYDSLYMYVNKKENFDITIARRLFYNTRYAYKKSELFIEYFAPSTAAMLNMALIPDVDEFDPNQLTQEPEGLQKIEELLFANDSNIELDVLVQELKRTRGAVLRAQQISKTLDPEEYQLFESCRQEIIRIFAFNLTGIDASFSKNAIIESKYAIHTIFDLLSLLEKNNNSYKTRKNIKDTKSLILKAETYLIENNNFDSFNRMNFIKQYLNEIYSNLVVIENQLPYNKNTIPTALNLNAKNIFDKNAWNIYYFSSEKKNTTNDKIVELGRMLFYDPILSGNNKRACASCHRPEYGFSEPLPTSLMFGQNSNLNRNAPTLLNVGFQKAFFHDARLTYLEDQIVEVNQNKDEMHGNFDELSKKLNASDEYRNLFKDAFKGSNDTIINKQAIVKAIASFERTLISMNSKFDKYMRNEKVELTKSEINGFNLFMGKAQCGTCHFAPFFNGTVPPSFDDTEWEILGVPNNKNYKNIDSDLGRYYVANMDIHKYAFKTSTVRNINYTAPYMHNGVFNTLEEVMEFYNNAGGIGHGYDVPNQTLPSDSLNLSKSEINDIIQFMGTLSDTTTLTKKPSKLPLVIIDGKIIDRKIGGEY